MAGGWLDISDASGTRREALRDGLTRIGGVDGEIPLEASGSDQLHVWDRPPRAIFVGGGTAPTLNGRALDEEQLKPGDQLEWHGVKLVYGGEAAPDDHAALEEIPLAPPPAPAAAQPAVVARGLPPEEDKVWKRLQAGLLVELSMADRVTAKRWQDAVMRDDFDADQCAREILARSPGRGGDPKMIERSGRLLRDLLMAPLLSGSRGASRKARQAAKGGMAMILSQGIAFVVYSLIVLAILLLLRLRGVEFDALFDRMMMRG